MAEWDGRALGHLEGTARQLTAFGVPAAMGKLIGGVFRRNLERYEPTEYGDTPQGFALLCAFNISQLAFRYYADLGAGDAGPVRASLPESNSLLVQACGVDLRVRKAPGATLSPVWSAFSWLEAEGVGRHLAATANSAAYQPASSDQDGRSATIDPNTFWSLNDPAALRHMVLAWAGDMDTGLTSGWLGFPCTGTPSWFAVTPLWRDEPGAAAIPADLGPVPATPPDSFDAQAEPKLSIGLRHPSDRPGQSGQA